MRKMSKARPLKLERLWIGPAICPGDQRCWSLIPAAAGPARRAVLTAQDWAWLALAGGAGRGGGWHWGRTMAIEVHPEDGTLMVRGGQAAILVLVVLILFRTGLRTGLAVEGRAWHLDMLLISDASIVFTACCSRCAVWRCICGPSG